VHQKPTQWIVLKLDENSGNFLYAIRFSIFVQFLLFWKCFDFGMFPEILKLRPITPVFKSGDISDAIYRPITIISHIGNLFELLVPCWIQHAIDQILVEEQHWFHPRWSVNTCDLVLTDYVRVWWLCKYKIRSTSFTLTSVVKPLIR